MKQTMRNLLLLTLLWILTLWILLPAWESWHWGRDAMVRLDPKISNDYNCVFIEAHSAKRFGLTWLQREIPDAYMRLRYTPLSEKQCYGIVFVDPRTLACEAHIGCASAPANLAGRLSSPQTILDWMRSQPGSLVLASHTNDAREIFDAVNILAPRNLAEFALPANYPMKNFAVGYTSHLRNDAPRWTEASTLALLWVGAIERAWRRKRNGPQTPI
jgi:hypothetical protein